MFYAFLRTRIATATARLVSPIKRFYEDRRAGVAIIFGLSLVPMLMFTEFAADYARLNSYRATVQQAMDSAVLFAIAQPQSSRDAAARSAFAAALNGSPLGSFNQPTFAMSGTQNYTGSVTARVPTLFSGIMSIDHLSFTVSAASSTGGGAQVCMLTLGQGLGSSASSFTLNGAPNMSLTGCAIQSNTSMNCNGHGGGATSSLAVGNVSGCTNPVPSSAPGSDFFAAKASSIVKKCGSDTAGLNWTPSVVPSGPELFVVTSTSSVEYHVCGNLNLRAQPKKS